jgi:hypothetical protein
MKSCINRIILCVLLVASGVCTSLGAMELWPPDDLFASHIYTLCSPLKSTSRSCCFNYSINLVWINKDFNKEQLFIHPSKDEQSLDRNFLDIIFEWALANKDASVNVWFDSIFITDEAVKNTQLLIEKRWNQKTMAPIFLKDIRSIPKVREYAEVFSNKVTVFFRADLVRVIIALHALFYQDKPTFFVYADLDAKPMTAKELFDAETLQKLKTYGIVLAKGKNPLLPSGGKPAFDVPFENGFQIISNGNAHLLEAMSYILVDLNIERAKNALLGKYFHRGETCPMEDLLPSVYASYPYMFMYWRSLEKRFELTLVVAGKRDYDKKIDGLRPFGLKHQQSRVGLARAINVPRMLKKILSAPAIIYASLAIISKIAHIPGIKKIAHILEINTQSLRLIVVCIFGFLALNKILSILHESITDEIPASDYATPTKEVDIPPSEILTYRDALYEKNHPLHIAYSPEVPYSADDPDTW